MYVWHLDPVVEVDLGQGAGFHSQAEAEAWLQSCYEELAEAGAAFATLYDGDVLVYGPMSLAEE